MSVGSGLRFLQVRINFSTIRRGNSGGKTLKNKYPCNSEMFELFLFTFFIYIIDIVSIKNVAFNNVYSFKYFNINAL